MIVPVVRTNKAIVFEIIKRIRRLRASAGRRLAEEVVRSNTSVLVYRTIRAARAGRLAKRG